jgi:hypothetical protein
LAKVPFDERYDVMGGKYDNGPLMHAALADVRLVNDYRRNHPRLSKDMK